MENIAIDLVSGSYQHPSLPVSSQRTVNLVPQVIEAQRTDAMGGASVNHLLVSRPGIALLATETNNNPCRMLVVMNGTRYGIFGTNLYKISSADAFTQLGVVTGTKRVSYAHNEASLCMVDPESGNGYVYDGISFSAINDADYLGRKSRSVTFVDGYFVHIALDGKTFFCSNLNQPLVFSALDFATPEEAPDLAIAVTPSSVSEDELLVWGADMCTAYRTDATTGTGFPFIQVDAGVFGIGLLSEQAVCKFAQTMCFMGREFGGSPGIFIKVGQAEAYKISTDAIDAELQKFAADDIEASFCTQYSMDGQMIAAFTVISDALPNRTFAYNMTASTKAEGGAVWFEPQSGTDESAAWAVSHIALDRDKWIVGHKDNGKFGELKNDAFEDFGSPIVWSVSTAPLNYMDNALFWRRVTLQIEAGVGLETGQGNDPVVRMGISNDGGRTFLTNEIERTIGKIGEYEWRATWSSLGMSRGYRVYRFRGSDPVAVRILKLIAEFDVGGNR